MSNPWIMFTYAGKTCIDIALCEWVDDSNPHHTVNYYVTPHHGKIPQSAVIEHRARTFPTFADKE